MKIAIKPISVNKCWQGQRFKSREYKAWQKEFVILLRHTPKINGWVWVDFTFFIHNFGMADENNFLKAAFDGLVLAKVIEDDRYVVGHSSIKKALCKQENEWIDIKITPVQPDKNKHCNCIS